MSEVITFHLDENVKGAIAEGKLRRSFDRPIALWDTGSGTAGENYWLIVNVTVAVHGLFMSDRIPMKARSRSVRAAQSHGTGARLFDMFIFYRNFSDAVPLPPVFFLPDFWLARSRSGCAAASPALTPAGTPFPHTLYDTGRGTASVKLWINF